MEIAALIEDGGGQAIHFNALREWLVDGTELLRRGVVAEHGQISAVAHSGIAMNIFGRARL